MDIVTLAAAKKYTKDSIIGLGAIQGANCTIQSIVKTGDTNVVTFQWTAIDGTIQTGTMTVVDGTDGVSITNVSVDTSNNHLMVTLSNGQTKDAGVVPTVRGETGATGADGKSAYQIAVDEGYVGTESEWLASLQGADGFSPTITVKTSTSDTYILTITTKDDQYDTPNLKGGGGSGGASALSDLTDVQLTSLHSGQILKYNGSKWVNSDGVEIDSLSDIADVNINNIADGQILAWDSTSSKWINVDATNPTQYSTMPAASSLPEGVVQYIGADTADYKRGYFYRSAPSVVSGSVVYSWAQIDTQPSNRNYEDLDNLPQINSIELKGNKSFADLDIQKTIQLATLPTATVANAGTIVQYIGNTTAELTKGYFYQSVYDAGTAGYKWANIDVSTNAGLVTRVTTLETNQGDISTLTVPGATNLVAAINALNNKGLTSIVYTEPNLILTYADGSTYTFNVRDQILSQTQIGELANVNDTTIQNTNVLQYDSAILGYKPYDIAGALTALLTSAKDYTDQEIASSVTDDAYICDAKPTCSLDSGTGNYIVIYYQNNVAKTTSDTTARFYYKVSGDPYCTSWFVTGDSSVDPVEFTYLLSTPDFDDYVNKNTDIVSTYNESMADKTKVPDVAALDALMAIVNTALGLKVNTANIVDNLLSQDATKVLSANQGYVLNGMVTAKQDTMQYAAMPTADSTNLGRVVEYVGVTSQAYTKGHFYTCVYDNDTSTYSWEEITFAPDMVAMTTAEVDALWA